MKKMLSLLLILCILLSGCGIEKEVRTDLGAYDADRGSIVGAADFMPELTELGDYTDIRYTYQDTCYDSWFNSDGMALFVKYDSETYATEKERGLGAYTFLEEPVKKYSDTYELPVTEFAYNGYLMKVVPIEDYMEQPACKSFMLLGLNDEACSIAYLYYHDVDLDYIAEAGDDLEAEMRGLVDVAFAWAAF